MRTAFYPFVSGTRPSIDQQLIYQALDAWSWFWVGVEATLVFILAGFGLIAGGAYEVGLETIGGAIVLAAIGLPAMRGQCSRYAIAQVRAIVADPRPGGRRESGICRASARPLCCPSSGLVIAQHFESHHFHDRHSRSIDL